MDIDQTRAPLWEALEKHALVSKGNFHIPGHKAGQVFDQEGLSSFVSVLAMDRTEVGELDDLHAPTGVIREAEKLAAVAFGSDFTRFLVGGTTAGNLAAILSLCRPNDIILVQRSCHQSVFHGCMLAGASMVPIPYKLDPVTGMEIPLSLSVLEKLLARYPKAKAVVVTSPSYFGVVQPIEKLADIVHQKGIPLVIDEAHGAHFEFHPNLPLPALRAGADVVIQSTHKMLTSLTMSSMLHIKGALVNRELILEYLQMVQSSSPSYPLMASLDLARRQAVLAGREKIDQVLTWLIDFRCKLATYPCFREITTSFAPMDPFKLTLTTPCCTGFELAKKLEQRGIYVELADDQNVLFSFSLATSLEELHVLLQNLDDIHKGLLGLSTKRTSLPLQSVEVEAIPYTECRTRQRSLLPIQQAIGKRSAVQLVPYPPGIPLVLMGEVIRREVVDQLISLLLAGGKVRGVFGSKDYYLLSVYTPIQNEDECT
jgi:arginine decarboxylase